MRSVIHRANVLLPAAGILALAAFVLLYVIDPHVYLRVIGLWFPRPALVPFFDSDIGAQIGCWQRGIDVYAADPCDILQRPFGYSPFWLRLWFLPSDLAWTNALGISQGVIFALSLAILPRAHGRFQIMVMLLALLSPATIFGVERSNPDLFMFVLAAGMVLCLERALPLRLAGYGAALLGGALKFYPVVLLLLLVRERVRVFLILATIGMAAIIIFFLSFHAELTRMMPNLPRPGAFEYSLGATQLGEGMGLVTGHAVWGSIISGVLLLGAAAGALRLALLPGFGVALESLSLRETFCLLVGADLMVGCFFAGVSAGYRAIHLLFALPSLLILTRRGPTPDMAALFRMAVWAVLLVMWVRIPMALLGVEHPAFLAGSTGGYLLFWLIKEAAWWFLITLFMAILLRMALLSPMWQTMAAWWPLNRLPPDGVKRG